MEANRFCPVCLRMTVSAAQKFRRDGSDHAGAEREGDQRIERGLIVPGAKSGGHQDDRGDHDRRSGQDKVAPDALEGRAPPRQQRADAGEEEKKEPDGQRDAIKEGRAHGDLVALHILRNDGEQRAPQDREAGRQQDQVVEQETRLARDQRFQLVL